MVNCQRLSIFISTFCLYGLCSGFLEHSDRNGATPPWLSRILDNCIGYALIIIPGFLLVQYVQRSDYMKRNQKGVLWFIIRLCVYGRKFENSTSKSSDGSREKDVPNTRQQECSVTKRIAKLVFCFVGLQGSYLTWGLLQEKIMTQNYSGVKFVDAEFLVFVNRVFGLVVALIYIWFKKEKMAQPPLYKYSFCAISNIMSSSLQYEAIKYVSFPTQVLTKTSKIIPVMLMGKLISRKTYMTHDYYTAALISTGMTLFLLNTTTRNDLDFSMSSVGVAGVVTLTLYMTFDSFTSNWQSQLFRVYQISPSQMMAGVNFCSLLIMLVPLFRNGILFSSLDFIFEHREFGFDCLILSTSSAVGQLFIYWTIAQFGPVVFTIIMTIRQIFAILLSCIFFGHSIGISGVVGASLVFVSLFVRTYCTFRLNSVKKSHNN